MAYRLGGPVFLRQSKGSFLLEVLLTVSILSVSLTVIVQSFFSSLRAAVYVSDYSTAMILLENKMNDLRQEGFIESPAKESGVFPSPFERFSYHLEAENVNNDMIAGGLNEVKVNVSWLSGKKRNAVSVTTYFLNSVQE